MCLLRLYVVRLQLATSSWWFAFLLPLLCPTCLYAVSLPPCNNFATRCHLASLKCAQSVCNGFTLKIPVSPLAISTASALARARIPPNNLLAALGAAVGSHTSAHITPVTCSEKSERRSSTPRQPRGVIASGCHECGGLGVYEGHTYMRHNSMQ